MGKKIQLKHSNSSTPGPKKISIGIKQDKEKFHTSEENLYEEYDENSECEEDQEYEYEDYDANNSYKEDDENEDYEENDDSENDEYYTLPEHEIPGVNVPDDENRTIDVPDNFASDDPDFSQMTKKEIKAWKRNQPERRYRRFRIKQAIVFTSVILTTITLAGFGVYTTFFRPIPTFEEIAKQVNNINGRYGFPRDGVLAYLDGAMMQLTESRFSGALQRDFTNILITDIAEKNYDMANIYFTATMHLSQKPNVTLPEGVLVPSEPIRIQAMMPLKYDTERGVYIALDNPRITPVEDTNAAANQRVREFDENPLYDFQKDVSNIIDRKDDRYIAVEKFIKNFLTILYNQKGDYSTFYKGQQVLSPIGKFMTLKKFEYYRQKNAMGFNVMIEFENQLVPGATFTNKMYMNIKPSGDTFIITKIQ